MSNMIEILEIKDNDDGSATVTFEMGQDAIMIFAKVGLLKVLIDSADDVIQASEGDSINKK